jgi:hypothetical protein
MSGTCNIRLVAPDERLAGLVSRFLERHGIGTTIIRQHSQLQPARTLCERAGVPILAFDARAGAEDDARIALRSLVAKIRDAAGRASG